MMGLVRKGKGEARGSGYIVTWDADSADKATDNRLMFFLFGRRIRNAGKEYRYGGFVRKDGVRYLGQSTLFVRPHRLEVLRRLLARSGVDHEVEAARVG